MKIISLVFLFLFPVFSVFSEEFPIDLTKKCDPECQERSWWIIDRVSPDDFTLQNPGTEWKEVKKFPIWLNQYFKSDKELVQFTLVTYFDMPDRKIFESKPIGISMGEIGEVFEIYVNGHLIVKQGEHNNEKVILHRTVRGQVWNINEDFFLEKNNQLLIRIAGHPKFDHTGFYLTRGYEISYFQELSYKYQDRVTLMLLSIYIAIGFYHLFLYYKRKVDKHNLLFSLFSIGLGIYLYTRSNEVFELTVDTSFIQRVELVVLYSFFVCYILFCEFYFFKKNTKKVLIYSAFCFSLSFLSLFPPMYIDEYLLRVWQLSALLIALPLIFIIFFKALKENSKGSRRLVFGMVLIVTSTVFDILDSLVLNTGLAFTKFTVFIFMLGIANVLANDFMELHNNLEDMNNNLEQKVELRTREVLEKMQIIENIMKQQNGDYFLTSLIQQPLTTNYNKSKLVTTEFFLEQKKKFEFKNRKSELGGDMCVAGNLRFYNKDERYVFFFNGDAMGKSMQGAGGAIVAGTVVNNILGRSAKRDNVLMITPEEWLNAVFMELDNVFRTFDGSMLLSGVIGVIHEVSGEFWFFNSEHPKTVLLRDRKASFLEEDEKNSYKLGTVIEANPIHIQKFQLLPGDVIICGSDGRDDLEMGHSTGNIRIINEDENLFLRNVEISDGNLKQLIEIIKKTGNITDDISMVRIAFQTDRINADDLAFKA